MENKKTNNYMSNISKNMYMTLIYQVVSIIFGFYIPKLIIENYGANLHGLSMTITNILQYGLLIDAGLGGASIQALYKPFALRDHHNINSIVKATSELYKKNGLIFSGFIVLFSLLLPMLVSGEGVDNLTLILLLIGMGLQQILERFLISTYKVFLNADQKSYIIYKVNIVGFIIRGIIQIILILNEFPIFVVQVIPSIVVLLNWYLLRRYIKKNYSFINNNVQSNVEALNKRVYAFAHQIAGFVLNNTDILLLSIFTNQISVSIYAVYNLVISHLHSLIVTVFSKSSVASFGHAFASKDLTSVQNKYSKFELLYYVVTAITYSVCGILLIPFVSLYTNGITDVDYINNDLAFLFILFGILNSLREPGIAMIDAVGLFKKARPSSIYEATINLSVSVVMIQFFGIVGVLIGTVVAFGYRFIDVTIMSNKTIMKQSARISMRRALQVILLIALNYTLFTKIISINTETWINWIFSSVKITMISSIITITIFSVSDWMVMKDLVRTLKSFLYSSSKKI